MSEDKKKVKISLFGKIVGYFTAVKFDQVDRNQDIIKEFTNEPYEFVPPEHSGELSFSRCTINKEGLNKLLSRDTEIPVAELDAQYERLVPSTEYRNAKGEVVMTRYELNFVEVDKKD